MKHFVQTKMRKTAKGSCASPSTVETASSVFQMPDSVLACMTKDTNHFHPDNTLFEVTAPGMQEFYKRMTDEDKLYELGSGILDAGKAVHLHRNGGRQDWSVDTARNAESRMKDLMTLRQCAVNAVQDPSSIAKSRQLTDAWEEHQSYYSRFTDAIESEEKETKLWHLRYAMTVEGLHASAVRLASVLPDIVKLAHTTGTNENGNGTESFKVSEDTIRPEPSIRHTS